MRVHTHTVHEHERIVTHNSDHPFLKKFVPSIFTRRPNGEFKASNYVGALTLPSGTVLEILPKVPMTAETEDETQASRELFLKMLKYYRGNLKTSDTSKILSSKEISMLSCFIHLFLNSLMKLVHEGLARQYVLEHDNLPFLKGRIEFKEHIRLNSHNKTRFFSSFGELSANRPVNRLIVTTLEKLQTWVGYTKNRKLLNDLRVLFADVPPSRNIHVDWKARNIDRSMPQYNDIMQWIGLFLFGHGLTTFSGTHSNIGIFFPMEQVFEDFVAKYLQKHATDFRVYVQGPKRVLVEFDDDKKIHMKPDIVLAKHSQVFYVLDAKWKVVDTTNPKENFQLAQNDLYQLYTYGKLYSSKAVVLIYPMNEKFREPLKLQFAQDIPLFLFPFDVRNPVQSVDVLLRKLNAV